MPEQNEAAAPLDVEDRFAIVPEWLLDADVSDAAVRLYAVLLRFGQTSGARMPSRSTLASRMRKKSTDSIDRAMRELVDLGAVVVQHRFDGGQRLTNNYLVRTSKPRRDGEPGGGRKNAATPADAATPTVAAGRRPAPRPRCARSPPTPPPDPRCGSRRPGRGGTNPSRHRPFATRTSRSWRRWKPTSPTPAACASHSSGEPASSSPPIASPSPGRR